MCLLPSSDCSQEEATEEATYGSGPGKVDLVLRQHSRIDLSLLQHQSTSEENHGRLLKRSSGDCRTCVTQAASGS